jgi:hypothetical protein
VIDDKKTMFRAEMGKAVEAAVPVQETSSKPIRRLVVQSLTDIVEEKPTWIWDRHIPRGAVSVLGGKGGVGKGLTLCDVIARLTRGDVMPDGSGGGEPGRVLLIAREDSASTLKARLRIAGADLSRIQVSTGDIADAKKVERAAESIEAAAPEIEAAIIMHGITWVIIDPIGAWIEDDGNNSAQVRAVIDPMTRVARRTGVAVTFAAHLRKAAAEDPSDAFSGSRSIVDAVRCALVQTKISDQERLVSVVKTNFKPPERPMVLKIGHSKRQESPDDPPGVEWRTATAEDRAAAIAAAKRGTSPVVPAHAVLSLLTVAHQPLKDLVRQGKRALSAFPGASEKSIKDAFLALADDGHAHCGKGPRGQVTIGLVPTQGPETDTARATAAWQANPGASVREIAKLVGCGKSLAGKTKPKVSAQGVHSPRFTPSGRWTPQVDKAGADVHPLPVRPIGAAGVSGQRTAAGADDEDMFEHAPLVGGLS